MRNSSPLRRVAPNPSVEATAHHMADAIGFLMRVADEAGLRNIVVRLAGVRASLLASARHEAEKTGLAKDKSEPDESNTAGDSK
jgi:hypothetical protein